MENTQLVNDLISITSRLITLMNTEVEALRAHDIKSVEALQSEKGALARAYETLIRELRKQPGVLREVAPALRDALVIKAREFQRLLVQNEVALRAAREVNARVLKAIADAVTDSKKEPVTYSRSGKPDSTKQTRLPISMTLNQTL